MKPLNEQITEIQALMEKIEGDSTGAVTGVKMDRGCPSAVRERLQIAADTAQMNEKNLRARQEALKGQIEAAEKGGDAAGAAKMRGEYDRLSTHRKTNLENMDRLESITSDYAVKHKPGDNNYEQRAHALFLQKQREKMETRMKEEEDSSFPNPDTLAKLQRRISRVDTAQKESEKWLSEKDPKWLKAHKEASVDPKEAVKKHKESISAERKAVADAQKEAEKAVVNGEAPPQTTAAAASPEAGGAERVQHTPGTTWQTSRGTFGAMNKGGIQKYFGSEEEAKVYAQLEKGSRRTGENRKRKTAVSAETKASTSGVAKEIVKKKLEVAASSKSKTVTDNPVKRSKPAPTFGKKKGGKFGRGQSGKKPVSGAWKPGKRTTRKIGTKAESFAADIVGKHLEKLNEGQDMNEAVSLETMEQGIKDCLAQIEQHKKLAKEAKAAGDTAAYKKHRDHIAERSADIKTIQGMIKRAKSMDEAVYGGGFTLTGSRRSRGGSDYDSEEQEAKRRAAHLALINQMKEQEAERKRKQEVQRQQDAVALARQKEIEAKRAQKKTDGPVVGIDDQKPNSTVRTKNGWRAKNNQSVVRYFDDPREAEAWLSGGGRGVSSLMRDREARSAEFHSRSMREAVSSIISNSLKRKSDLTEEEKKEKPYKGFVKGKNHPEGGLSRAEAKRQGIHAGIETKDEAERKGGFSKLSPATQKRRHSFCSRMCGMKAKNTSAETAKDPDSKINAALRVWGCRC